MNQRKSPKSHIHIQTNCKISSVVNVQTAFYFNNTLQNVWNKVYRLSSHFICLAFWEVSAPLFSRITYVNNKASLSHLLSLHLESHFHISDNLLNGMSQIQEQIMFSRGWILSLWFTRSLPCSPWIETQLVCLLSVSMLAFSSQFLTVVFTELWAWLLPPCLVLVTKRMINMFR